MIGRPGWIALSGAVVAFAAFVAPVVIPTSFDDYRKTAVQAAQDALGQVRTVALVVEAARDGRTLKPYVSQVFWQSREALGTAQKEMAAEEVPDARAKSVEAQIVPLLAASIRQVNAAEITLDDDVTAAGTAVRELTDLGDQLAVFVGRYR
ncbi:hypothetical protein [Amycolatopsis sp. NPDC051071]|uniref:hypothetical protein n=1 Tax=Amycolatopsis sp. NPDC051071 TaxID=3154637 RepID=UPI00341D9230